MKKLYIAIIILVVAAASSADPILTPQTFLNAGPPERMCQDFLDTKYGPNFLGFATPCGGASIRIDLAVEDLYLYFFCDRALDRIMIFSLTDNGQKRTPRKVKAYGIQRPPYWYTFMDSLQADSSTVVSLTTETTGYFSHPVDICTSANGRYFRPWADYIYVLDQGNHRAVILKYDFDNDSLLWVGTFGENILVEPTAIDYADYRDSNSANDDIYITDGELAKVIRFSVSGELEESYGGHGSGLPMMGYPTGIAIGTDPNMPNTFYVCDMIERRVVRYESTSDGPIMAENFYRFPRFLPPNNFIPEILAIDTDSKGNLYILNKNNHNITIRASDLSTTISQFGCYGFVDSCFNYPIDIIIDKTPGKEMMQVCEAWNEQTGIRTIKINYDTEKLPLINPSRKQY